eukprot:319418_1
MFAFTTIFSKIKAANISYENIIPTILEWFILFYEYKPSKFYEGAIAATVTTSYHSPYLVIPLVTNRYTLGLNRLPHSIVKIFKIYNAVYYTYIATITMNIINYISFDNSLNYGLFAPSISIINDHIALGRMPYSKEIEIINNKPFNIQTVINMCAEMNGPINKYRQYGIKDYNFGVVDDTPPKDEDVFKCIQIINEFIQNKRTDNASDRILIHCQFGKGRSALIVLCWLISTGMNLNDAFLLLKQNRCHVSKSVLHYDITSKVISKYRK